MSQVFPRRAELAVKLAAAALVLGVLAAVAIGAARLRGDLQLRQALAQPIPFSHKHHVGDVGIDCRYCHATVETAAFAGMPSTGVCMGCHAQLFADAPLLEPLRRSAASGRPLAWRRVHELPDFVYFDHGVHVAKGVACVECHGRVDQMPLTWREAPLQMQWCLACHRDPAPHLRRRDRVFDPAAPRLSREEAELLARSLRLPDTRRLTDCSTCHR